jgi:predicted HicB family RNase H-like nuclease
VTAGRPASPLKQRSQVRHSPEEMRTWRVAAALDGITLNEWIRVTLRRAVMVKRKKWRP